MRTRTRSRFSATRRSTNGAQTRGAHAPRVCWAARVATTIAARAWTGQHAAGACTGTPLLRPPPCASSTARSVARCAGAKPKRHPPTHLRPPLSSPSGVRSPPPPTSYSANPPAPSPPRPTLTLLMSAPHRAARRGTAWTSEPNAPWSRRSDHGPWPWSSPFPASSSAACC